MPLILSNDMLPPRDGQDLPVYIRADRLTGHQDRDFEASGHAELRKRDQSIVADWIRYLKASDEVEARGHVRIEQEGSTIEGTDLQLQIRNNIGHMDKPVYHLDVNDSRGHASLLEFTGKSRYRLHKAVYTTCPVGNDDWFLRVKKLDIDRVQEVGIAHDASVQFKGVPILYMPWLDFPISERRRSGFLAPVFGSTAAGGAEITLPYYWNIAPNFDATIAPRFMTKRGMMLNNEFRYLEPGYSGEVHFNVLPHDNITGQMRDEMRLEHRQDFGGRWSGGLDLQRVSDNKYYRDLSPQVILTSQTILPREGHLTYDGGWWNFTSRVQKFQALQDPLAPVVVPYYQTPQFLLNAARYDMSGLDATFIGEFDNFSHPTLVNGKRLVVYPAVSYPLRTASAFLTPRLGLHSASYTLGANNAAGLPDSSINVPIFSLDSGVYLDRKQSFGSRDFTQTLEPRLYYVYIPYRNQNNLPNFDSAPMDFNFGQLFSENQFSGNDRVGDADQLTLALTSRLIDGKTGEERLKGSIAQRIYIQSPKLIPVTTSKSDIIATASGVATRALHFDTLFQYDPNKFQTKFVGLYAHYLPSAGKVLNFGYLYNRNILSTYYQGQVAGIVSCPAGYSYNGAICVPVNNAVVLPQTLEQVDISGEWPLARRWHGVARWNYSMSSRQLLEGIVGLEYDSDCWALRIVTKRFASAYQQLASAFFVQLELNGLARIGPDPLDTLRTSIPGYSKTNMLSN